MDPNIVTVMIATLSMLMGVGTVAKRARDLRRRTDELKQQNSELERDIAATIAGIGQLTPLEMKPSARGTERPAHLLVVDELRQRADGLRSWALVSVFLTVTAVSICVLLFSYGPDFGETVASAAGAVTYRIGVTLLLVYLVKILTGIYRFNYRLAAFYHGRADAIQLCGAPATINHALRSLNPDGIDFDPAPASPVDEAARLIEKLQPLMGELEPLVQACRQRPSSHGDTQTARGAVERNSAPGAGADERAGEPPNA